MTMKMVIKEQLEVIKSKINSLTEFPLHYSDSRQSSQCHSLENIPENIAQS